MLRRVHEQRLVERGLADFVIATPDDYLVVGVGFNDFEALVPGIVGPRLTLQVPLLYTWGISHVPPVG